MACVAWIVAAGAAAGGVVAAEGAAVTPGDGGAAEIVPRTAPAPESVVTVGVLGVISVVCAIALARRGALRAARLKVRLDALTGAQTAWMLACGLGVWLAWAFGGALALTLMGATPGADAPPSLRAHGVVGLAACLTGGVAIVVVMRVAGSRRREVGLAWRGADWLLGFGALLLALPFVLGAGEASRLAWSLLGGAAPEGAAHTTLTMLFEEGRTWGVWGWVAVALAVAGAPVIEEVVYRVFLQGALLRATRRPWVAIVCASACFALIHAGAVPVYGLPTLFVLGLALGVAMERTGRVGACVVMHAVFNGLNLIVASLA